MLKTMLSYDELTFKKAKYGLGIFFLFLPIEETELHIAIIGASCLPLIGKNV